MRKFLLIGLFLSVLTTGCKETTYTVIVSMDAFRWDYPNVMDAHIWWNWPILRRLNGTVRKGRLGFDFAYTKFNVIFVYSQNIWI